MASYLLCIVFRHLLQACIPPSICNLFLLTAYPYNTGFEYRISKQPETGKINAIFWTYPEQRFDLVTYGRVMFVDATHGTTHYDWPLFTPCIVNSDRKIRPIGYCLVDSECDLSQSWMLSAIIEIEPSWADIAQVIFTDDKLSSESILQVVPNVTTCLCWWHLVYRDLENVRNCGRLAELGQIREFVIAEFVYCINEAHIEAKWQEFQV